MIITIKFSDSWLISEDGSHGFKALKYFNRLSTLLDGKASLTRKGVDKFTIEFPDDDKENGKYIVETITSLADEILPDIPKDALKVEFEDGSDVLKAEVEDGSETEKIKSTIEFINALIGLEDFKAFCNEIVDSADIIRQNINLFFSEALLCVSDDGNGFDEKIDWLVQLLYDYDIIKDRHINILSWGSFFDKPEEFPSFQIRCGRPDIYVFDIRGWIGYTNDSRFKNALKFVFESNKDNLIIFRMGNRSKTVIEDTVREIEDIINLRVIEYPDFTDEQLFAYAKREFDALGFSVDDNAYDVFKRIINYEKEDGLFYGIKTVKKIAEEMARVSIKSGSKNSINPEACNSIIPQKADADDSLKLIEDMIGMEDVARQVREIIAQVMFSRANGTNSPAMHMFFIGNPGTGKTTVARAIGKIFRENHILRAGKFFEHKGRDLCGEYVGHTAAKVNRICKAAYGSVLFIDEAYSLAADRESRDFGKEAIDTLIAEMENHSDELVVIFAGYPDEMENLLDTNPGMRSRIPYRIVFPNYSKEQLYQIYMKMVEKNNFKYTDDFSQRAKDYFLALPDDLLESKQFGNARFVRNLFERTWGKAALRCPAGSYEIPSLEAADFDATAAELIPPKPKKVKKVGF